MDIILFLLQQPWPMEITKGDSRKTTKGNEGTERGFKKINEQSLFVFAEIMQTNYRVSRRNFSVECKWDLIDARSIAVKWNPCELLSLPLRHLVHFKQIEKESEKSLMTHIDDRLHSRKTSENLSRNTAILTLKTNSSESTRNAL